MFNRASGWLSLAALLLSSCASHPGLEAPPVQPLVQKLPPAPVSHLAVPITVELAPLRDRIMKSVPRPLSQGTQNQGPVQIRHRLTLVDLGFIASGNRLTAVADLDLAVGASAQLLVKTPLASCGENGTPTGRLRISMPGTLFWKGDGQIEWARDEKWSMQWRRPCDLTALHIDLNTLLQLPVVRTKVEQAISQQLAGLPEDFAVRPIAEKAWAQLLPPRSLAAGTWLCLQPESLAVSAIRGDAGAVHTTITLTARPELVFAGTAPVTEKHPLPRIAIRQAPGSRFAMDFPVETTLEHADSLLTKELSARPYQEGSHVAVVKSARVYASGGRAVLGLSLTKPFTGEVYVFGTPVFDTAAQTLRFDSVEYSLASESRLAKTADWLLHSAFRSYIAGAARVDFRTELASIRQKASTLRLDAGDGVIIQGGLTRLVPMAVDISETALRIHVRAEGDISVSVGR